MNIKLEIYRKICKFILCISFSVMVICYSIHIQLLPMRGNNNDYIPSIIDNSLYNNTGPDDLKYHASVVLRSLISFLYKDNFDRYNQTYSSFWFQWPLHLCKIPILYSENDKYLLSIGNIFVYIPLFFLNILALFSNTRQLKYERVFFPGLLYMSSLLSYTSPFSYHYFPEYTIPLYFSYYCAFTQIEKMKGFYKGFIKAFFLIASLLGFLVFSVYIYGFTISDSTVIF